MTKRFMRVFAFVGVGGLLAGCAPVTVETGMASEAPTGAYLGQEPPGAEAAVFAPGIVSTGMYERDIAISADGSEIYWGVVLGNYGHSLIMQARMGVDGRWGETAVAPFSGEYKDLEPMISPDGGRLYFASHRPREAGGEVPDSADIWYVERQGDGWGEPRAIDAPVNTDGPEFFPSVTRDGTLYFTRDFEGGASAIFRARPLDGGGYAEPEKLGPEVNSTSAQYNSFIAPDESYLIYGAYGREDSLGATDYYISFRADDDSWTGPIHMGPAVNSRSGSEYSPFVSADGRFFFFMTSRSRFADDRPLLRTAAEVRAIHEGPRNGLPDIWWIDASFIDSLRP